MSFVARILTQVGQQPSRPWLIEMHGDSPLPVRGRTLLQWVGNMRAALRAQGVKAGDRVMLIAPNSARWVAADLAILAEGAVTVPVYARQEVADSLAQITDAAPSLVLIDSVGELEAALPEALPRLSLKVASEGDAQLDEAAVVETAHKSLATLIYTSGTSGQSKGVMLSHGNLEAMLSAVESALNALLGGIAHEEHVFHYLPLCFAGSRVALLTQLLRQTPVTLSTDLSDLQRELKAARPHYFLNVPMLLERMRRGVEGEIAKRTRAGTGLLQQAERAYLREIAGEASLRDRLTLSLARRTLFPALRTALGSNLRFLICGSAPLREDTQRWFEMLGLPVYQVYGLTETTAIVSLDDADSALPGTVGQALDICETKLSAEGELLVRGPHVFQGYWRKDQATREAFEDGWFRTGDVATLDEAGRLRIVGRQKNLVIMESGHNVAPEPIERSLQSHLPGVEHAVLVGQGRPFLAVLLTGKASTEAVQAAIETVNAELPHYQQIRAHLRLETSLGSTPGLLTANQKLRRSAIERHYSDDIDALYRRKRTTSGVVRLRRGVWRAWWQRQAKRLRRSL